MSIGLKIVAAGSGTCSLTGKEGTDGLTVGFESEAPCFVSWKAFRQLLSFRLSQSGKSEVRVPAPATLPAVPLGNGSK